MRPSISALSVQEQEQLFTQMLGSQLPPPPPIDDDPCEDLLPEEGDDEIF